MSIEPVGSNIYEVSGIEGAAFMLNTEGVPYTTLLPFVSSADADQITATPYIPDGVSLGPMTSTPYGYKWDMSNGNDLYIVDGQDGKLADIMPDWYAKGFRIVLRMPKANIPGYDGDDVLRIPKLIIGGNYRDFDFLLQPELTAQEIAEGHERPKWAEMSYIVRHKTKRHNKKVGGVLVDDYKCGIVASIPRPRAELLDGATRKGGVWGWYEYENHGNGTHLLTKCFAKADIQALMATVNPGDWTHVAVDAVLGFSTMGTSLLNASLNYYYFGNGTDAMPENGTADSLSYGLHATGATTFSGAIYEGDVSTMQASELPLTEGIVSASASYVAGSPSGYWGTIASATNPSLTSGTKYTQGLHYKTGMTRIRYVADAGANRARSSSAPAQGSSWPDPDGFNVNLTGYNLSMYITYTPGGGGGGVAPLVFHHRQLMGAC